MSRTDVLPISWTAQAGPARVGGVPLGAVAEQHGTPVYVVDVAHIRARLQAFRAAFAPDTVLVYAAKAFMLPALAELLAAADWSVDVVSLGELQAALAGGLSAERLILHGNVKTDAELGEAIRAGVGRIVADDPSEIPRTAALAGKQPVRMMLRLNVEVGVDTHPKIRTSGPASHFGMDEAGAEQALDLISRVGAAVALTGVHTHVGSQITDPAVFARATEALAGFVLQHRRFFPEEVEVDVGGGFAVPYLWDDPVVPVESYAEAITSAAEPARRAIGGLRLLVEPGRAVVANAGVTVYRVISRKDGPMGAPILAVDGGMSDNPRSALYGARYEAVLIDRPSQPHRHPFRVVGRHCETGDVLISGAYLPADVSPGELLMVPATGAYNFAMAGHYNLVDRPAVVFVEDGAHWEVVPRRPALDSASVSPTPDMHRLTMSKPHP